jgi:hypothetical protein
MALSASRFALHDQLSAAGFDLAVNRQARSKTLD